MSTELPVFLLDVDGVLNATRPGWGGALRKREVWSNSSGRPFTLRWAPPLIDRIKAIQRDGLAEIRWCTTWCPDAEALEALWAFKPLVRAFTDRPEHKTWAELKAEAAVAVIDSGARLVWTDDTEAGIAPRFYPALAEAEKSGQALLIAPRASRGLQPEDMDRIDTFLKETA